MRKPRLALAVLLLSAPSSPAVGDDPKAAATKLVVEFGWDEPDTAFLRRHSAAMERTPFDGCVFHAMTRSGDGKAENFAWKAWGRRAYTAGELASAFDDLRATRWNRFRANFLRVNTTPADLDWFDDHAPVVANLALAARLAREGGCLGVLLDTEAYEGPLFDYRRQRDARVKSFDAYADRAKRRGVEVMGALQEGFPGLTVLLTFGPSLVLAETRGGKVPPQDTPSGLLAPFVEGMADARRGGARIVDGHEPSYGYRDPAQFDTALSAIRAARPKVEAGFGLWLDYDWRTRGWDADDPSKNYFTPERFEASVRAAIERSDRLVWVYTETPRWWTEEGGPLKLPDAYVEALRRARRDPKAD